MISLEEIFVKSVGSLNVEIPLRTFTRGRMLIFSPDPETRMWYKSFRRLSVRLFVVVSFSFSWVESPNLSQMFRKESRRKVASFWSDSKSTMAVLISDWLVCARLIHIWSHQTARTFLYGFLKKCRWYILRTIPNTALAPWYLIVWEISVFFPLTASYGVTRLARNVCLGVMKMCCYISGAFTIQDGRSRHIFEFFSKRNTACEVTRLVRDVPLEVLKWLSFW